MTNEEKRENISKTVQELAKLEKRDHGRNVILAAISAIPVAGGPLSSLLSEYLPNWKEKRILIFIEELQKEMQKFQDKINDEYVRSEDFALLFEETFLRVLRTNSDTKIAAYKGILVNACITTNVKEIEKEYFLDLVNRLQDIHLLVLSLFWNQEKFGQIHNSSPPDFPKGAISSIQVIKSYMKPLNVEEDIIKYAIRDLENMGILAEVYLNVPGARESLDLSGRINDFGRRFIDFITIKDENTL